jgi:hypothetical protein
MCSGEGHDFYCMNCGRAGIPVFRKAGKEREKFHRKRLYCPWCKKECNHIEVRNESEKLEFIQQFNEGAFQEELKESLQHCQEVI